MKLLAISAMLSGGDRRSIGRSNEVVELVQQHPERFSELIGCLWNHDPIVRMRAADTAEKVSALRPGLLAPFKSELLGLLVETDQRELRWHLAQMIPRLSLNASQQRRATTAIRSYLTDSSSIVRTFAMQALADMAGPDARLRSNVATLIEELVRTGTPAMRARGRKLVKQLRRLPSTA